MVLGLQQACFQKDFVTASFFCIADRMRHERPADSLPSVVGETDNVLNHAKWLATSGQIVANID